MNNLTFKARGIKKQSCKSLFVQKQCGKHTVLVQTKCPFEDANDFYLTKPKNFSTSNWMLPYFFAKKDSHLYYRKGTPEQNYQAFKEWLNCQSKEVTVEISCKLQHLAMCFDSPHFDSCGAQLGCNFDKANERIISPNVFCIFTRDRRGMIDNRYICKHDYNNNIIYVYMYYGNDNLLQEPMRNLLRSLSGCAVLQKGSFL